MKLNKFLTVLVALLTLCGMQAKAEDHVSIQGAEIEAGNTFTLPIELINEAVYKGFQMDIVLPEGITPYKKSNGRFVITKDAVRMEDTDHSIASNYIESTNTLKLVCTSMEAYEFLGNSGSLFTVQLQVANNIKGGDYQVTLTGIKFTDVNNIGHDLADATATFTVPGSAPQTFKLTWVVDGQSTETEVESGTTITKPTDPVKEGYTFAGWKPDVAATMPAEDVTYTAQWTVNTYKVTWVVDGQNTVEEVEFGAAITKPADPKKDGYEFTGWTPEVAATMPAKDVTYQAVFVAKAPDGDHVSIQSAEIEAGKTFFLPVELINETVYKGFQMDIVLPEGITPYKKSNGRFVITKDAVRMEDTDHSIASNYIESTNTLKLVCTSMEAYEFLGNSGSLFTVQLQAAEGLNPGDYEVKLAGIKFTDVDNQGHEFADATATFTVPEPYVEKNKVTWVIGEGQEIVTEVPVGAAITQPADTLKEGYTFTGWDKEIPATMPAEDLTFTAKWTINKYNLTWVVDGQNTVAVVEYGAAITKPADPEKVGYTFAGWTPEVAATMPAEDVTYTAQWTANKYNVTWTIEGESQVTEVEYGATITAPAVPTKDGYLFMGWNPAIAETMPAEALSYEAVFVKDQVSMKSADIEPGTTFALPIELINGRTYKAFQMDIVLPEGIMPYVNDKGKFVITKDADRMEDTDHTFSANYIDGILKIVCTSMEAYEFLGNTGTLFTVQLKVDANLLEGTPEVKLANIKFTTADNVGFKFDDAAATFNISFVPTNHTYEFKAAADAEAIATGTVKTGEAITAPADPTKEGYTFKGWDPEFTGKMPHEDVTYVAQWEINQYTMTFVLDNGQENVVKTQDFGTVLSAPADFSKTGFTFKGWTPAVPDSVPAGDQTFTAQWERNNYKVTWIVDGQSQETVVPFDNAITKPADPAKVGYTFAGWTPAVADKMPAENLVYTAQWTINKHKVTWLVDGQSTEVTVNYGDSIQKPADPTKEGYTFTGWTPAIAVAMPDNDVTYTAQWTVNKYLVTFIIEGQETKSQMEYGAAIVAPEIPEIEGMRFMKWAPALDATVPARDVTYEAIYALVVVDTVYVEVHDTVRVEVEVSTLQQVDAPFIDVDKDGKIVLSCHQKDAQIYYTTDGTDPTEASQLYSEPFEVPANATEIKAIAVLRSKVATRDVTGIKNIRMNAANGKVYNLQGRQVSKVSRGVFIQDGKKVVVK